MSRAREVAPPFLTDKAFLRNEVLPLLGGQDGENDAKSARIIDNRDEAKITAEYVLADGSKVFAKLYTDPSEKENPEHTYRLMRALWEDGFGEGSWYRISEPLAHLPERSVLVVRGAPGVSVDTYLGTGSPEQLEGVREAARWLARLHAAPVRMGRPWGIWRNYARLAQRFAFATARRPHWSDDLREKLGRLAPLAAEAQTPPRLVQTHGQFRDLHIFIDDGTVSGIDLDRSLPADPAKDLDEFLHRLRWKTFKLHRKQSDDLTHAFLREYAAEAPRENLNNLPFYWAYHALASLVRHVPKKQESDPEWQDYVGFHSAEFELAAEGRLETYLNF